MQPKKLCGLPNLSRPNASIERFVSGGVVAMNLRSYRVTVAKAAMWSESYDLKFECIGPLPIPKTLAETCRVLILLSEHRPKPSDPTLSDEDLAEHPEEQNFRAFLEQFTTEALRDLCIVWEIGFTPTAHRTWEGFARHTSDDRQRLTYFLGSHRLALLKTGLARMKKTRNRSEEGSNQSEGNVGADMLFTLDDEPEPFTLESFFEVNEDLTQEQRAEVEALKVGETVMFGGGAAAEMCLKRVE